MHPWWNLKFPALILVLANLGWVIWTVNYLWVDGRCGAQTIGICLSIQAQIHLAKRNPPCLAQATVIPYQPINYRGRLNFYLFENLIAFVVRATFRHNSCVMFTWFHWVGNLEMLSKSDCCSIVFENEIGLFNCLLHLFTVYGRPRWQTMALW